jgi:hypothetical protein
VRVGVYNYLSIPTTATVTLTVGGGGGVLEVTNTSAASSVDLAAGEAGSVVYGVRGVGLGATMLTVTAQTPLEVGKADAVQRVLTVDAEGAHRTAVSNLVLSLDGDAATASGTLQVAQIPIRPFQRERVELSCGTEGATLRPYRLRVSYPAGGSAQQHRAGLQQDQVDSDR